MHVQGAVGGPVASYVALSNRHGHSTTGTAPWPFRRRFRDSHSQDRACKGASYFSPAALPLHSCPYVKSGCHKAMADMPCYHPNIFTQASWLSKRSIPNEFTPPFCLEIHATTQHHRQLRRDAQSMCPAASHAPRYRHSDCSWPHEGDPQGTRQHANYCSARLASSSTNPRPGLEGLDVVKDHLH